jgi:hypothetical protein
MGNFKQYEKYKKSLNKKEKQELRNNIFFIRTVMTCTLTLEGTEKYSDHIDDFGWAEFYELIMEICDEVLLSNNSVFLTYIKLSISGDEEAEDYFDTNYGTCYDWYFMDQAREELTKRMEQEKEEEEIQEESTIEKLGLTRKQVLLIVKEWYTCGMCADIFQNDNGQDLEEYLEIYLYN